jgi:D-serine deaminase-like pyridoxal phosphate-dependent protein
MLAERNRTLSSPPRDRKFDPAEGTPSGQDLPSPLGVGCESLDTLPTVKTDQLTTPALVVQASLLAHNLKEMSKALPGPRLRPHVKAHKCTALATRQAQLGHTSFTCATMAEMEGMARAGLGDDLLLANEVADATRLGELARRGSRVTVAVDSTATITAASSAGVPEVLIDVNVGLPRCGCPPSDAGQLADLARGMGLIVRGVMGYEGHIVGLADRTRRTELLAPAMELLCHAHSQVGGDVISAGGTGTYDINQWATEIQAGSYVLMDTAYGKLDLPFAQALSVLATVISVSNDWAVANCGLKALGMDHGDPSVEDGQVLFCSDEHLTFVPHHPVKVGDPVSVIPAHVDPTVAYHQYLHVVDDGDVVESWPIDLRGW